MFNSANIYRMVASESDGLPAVQVASFDRINKETFALQLTTPVINKDCSQQEFSEALASLTENKFQIVPDSLFRSPNNPGLLRCIAFTNVESKPATKKNIAAMTKMSANVLEDDKGALWRTVGEGENMQIVRVSEEDFAGLLKHRQETAQSMTASVADDIAPVEYEDTDYVYFVNPDMEAMDFGFVVKDRGKDYVVSRAMKGPVQIHAAQVIEAASTAGSPLMLTAKRAEYTRNNALQDYINYLKELWGARSDYVRAWETAVKNSVYRVR